MDYPIPTTLLCEDLALGWQTGFDIVSTLSPIAESASVVRSWNGIAKNLAADEFKLFAVRLSASGDMRPPALSRLWPGATFQVVPTDELGDSIASGGSSRTLIRTPHPGSVRCLDLAFNDIPFTVAGKVVTLDAPAEATVRIFYRPVLEVFVVEPWTSTWRERSAEQSWDLSAEETGPSV